MKIFIAADDCKLLSSLSAPKSEFSQSLELVKCIVSSERSNKAYFVCRCVGSIYFDHKAAHMFAMLMGGVLLRTLTSK